MSNAVSAATAPAATPTVALCTGTLASGRPCTYRAKPGSEVCGVHGGAKTHPVTEPAECSVCLGDMKRRRTASMECGHEFHTTCLRSWFRNRPLSCPLCRGVCLEGVALMGPRLAPRLHALMRTVPPPSRGFFPSYIISQLENPRVAKALGLDADQVELLVDLACECFTQTIFFAKIRAIGL